MSKISIGPTHSFDINIATQFNSIEIAILVQHFLYWISFNRRLNRNFKDGHTWNYCSRKSLSAHFPYWNETQIKYWLQQMIDKGILIKNNYNRCPIDKTCWYAFKEEEKWGISKNVYEGQNCPSLDKITQPIPESIPTESNHVAKSIDIKGNVLAESKVDAKTMPFNSKNHEGIAGQKFPLKKEQQKTFDWLKSLNLDTDDKTLCIWVRMYSIAELENAYRFTEYEINRGVKIRSKARFIRSILNGEINPLSEAAYSNRKLAEDYKKEHNWRDLEIRNKDIFDNRTRKDLPYDMDSMLFFNKLMEYHNLNHCYRN